MGDYGKMIIVRETRLDKADDLHKYMPRSLDYINAYSNMCCRLSKLNRRRGILWKNLKH